MIPHFFHGRAGGWPTLLMMSVCTIYAEGAPSLRFLQGRVTMLPTQLLWLCNPVAHAFQVPALCKVRKGRGTHYVFGASEVKSLGHPPPRSPHVRRVAHPLMMSVCAIYGEGAPSLRFLQGRVTMLPTQLLSGSATRSRMRSRFPPFAKCAKDGAPTMFLAPARSKAWATRPTRVPS